MAEIDVIRRRPRQLRCQASGLPTQTPTYRSWASMRYRCLYSNATGWKNYGGRGILFTLRWLKYENFFKDMGERPSGMTLDRVDTNRGYYLDNCRWATVKTQSRNRRNTRLLTIDGVRKCLTEWEEHYGLPNGILRQRIKLGWSGDKLFQPSQKSTISGASVSTTSLVATSATVERVSCKFLPEAASTNAAAVNA